MSDVVLAISDYHLELGRLVIIWSRYTLVDTLESIAAF